MGADAAVERGSQGTTHARCALVLTAELYIYTCYLGGDSKKHVQVDTAVCETIARNAWKLLVEPQESRRRASNSSSSNSSSSNSNSSKNSYTSTRTSSTRDMPHHWLLELAAAARPLCKRHDVQPVRLYNISSRTAVLILIVVMY